MHSFKKTPLVDRSTVVAVQLRHLMERLNARQPRIDDAILASVSLRVLFDQGLLGRVARDHGIDLKVKLPKLDTVPVHSALAFACGGYELAGGYVQPYYLYREPGLSSPFRKQFEEQVAASPKQHEFVEVDAQTFANSPCLAFLGRPISRADAVGYVANKCGGAHAFHRADIDSFRQIEVDLTDMGKALHLEGSGLNVVCAEILGTCWLLQNSPAIGVLQKKLFERHTNNVIGFPTANIRPG